MDVPESYGVKKISLGGMLIESESPLEIEERIPMEIILPGDIHIKFLGRIASSLKVSEVGTSRYNIGIEFIEMPEEDKKKLQEFILVLDKAE
jgi:c-di-GMP-binding flagellar brake protein YcgR